MRYLILTVMLVSCHTPPPVKPKQKACPCAKAVKFNEDCKCLWEIDGLGD